MELLFADNALVNRRPFILNREMKWVLEINHFLHSISVESGKTASIHTSRAYGYHLLDWLRYAELSHIDWKCVSYRQLVQYRNELANHVSALTKQVLKRETINLRLGMICNFYRFLVRHKYISALPFELEEVSFSRSSAEWDEMVHLGHFRKMTSNPLMYRTHRRSIEVPTNSDVRRFIQAFSGWRNRLIAELMWITGLRRSEVCELTIFVLPENLDELQSATLAVRIKGKGSKYRRVKFPVRLLRSIQKYACSERSRLLKKSGIKTDRLWLGRRGGPIQPAAINKFFNTNQQLTGIEVRPHLLRHSFAVNRLHYLQTRNVKSALKILQGELGHSSLQTTEIYLHETDIMRAESIAEHSQFIAQLTEHGA